MSQQLPPELVPQLTPPSRAGTLAECQAMLDDLAHADCADDFLCLRILPDGFIETKGVTGGVDACKRLIAVQLFDLREIAGREGDLRACAMATLMLSLMGAVRSQEYGGIRSVGAPPQK